MSDLANLVSEIKPRLVVLVAMMKETAGSVSEWPMWLPEVVQKGAPQIGFGGKVFTDLPEWRSKVSGIFLGTSIETGVETIEKLLA